MADILHMRGPSYWDTLAQEMGSLMSFLAGVFRTEAPGLHPALDTWAKATWARGPARAEQVDDFLDEAIESLRGILPEVAADRKLMAHAKSVEIPLEIEPAAPDSIAAKVVGLGVTRILDQTFISFVHMSRAIEAIEADPDPRTRHISKTVLSIDPWALHDGYPVPHSIMTRVIDFFRGVAAFLLIVEAMRAEQPINTSIARAMAEVFRDGCRGYLELLASLPQEPIPTDVVPVENRLDLEKLIQKMEQSEAKLRERLASGEFRPSVI